ncbi:XRE family transcriptional regulator [Granulicella sp. WH15]|uniref:helix-turn-helix domain-containing protein n=1 Tax=Granulicella sp. WH15 TaxID=2602070 RepID=UPI001366B4B1|nr:helix-turn-helix transcriptional regulator [Granulicella sp. WH15]QHN03411.1 XRE family transcriptional regulator [Granulicella sp. WH15]
MKNASNKPEHITKGDIFDDLGFSPAETLEMKVKAEIWQALVQHIEQHGFTQAYLVATLKAHQPDVSNLLRGRISRISITKLIQFAARLNLDARVKVTSPKATGKALPSLKASTAKSSKSKRELAHA